MLERHTLKEQDSELQIRLAELQADVQINLAIAIGFLGAFISVLLGYQQMYFSQNLLIDETWIVIVMALGSFLCIFFVILFVHRALNAKRKMRELRKMYHIERKIRELRSKIEVVRQYVISTQEKEENSESDKKNNDNVCSNILSFMRIA